MNANSTWKTGQRVSGVYFGQEFTGSLTDDTRPTPDYRNVIFCVELDSAITVFGCVRTRIEIHTNDDNSLAAI